MRKQTTYDKCIMQITEQWKVQDDISSHIMKVKANPFIETMNLPSPLPSNKKSNVSLVGFSFNATLASFKHQVRRESRSVLDLLEVYCVTKPGLSLTFNPMYDDDDNNKCRLSIFTNMPCQL